MRRFQVLWITVAIFIFALSSAGQATCPADVILALARAGSACLGLERDQACFGNGAVNALGFNGAASLSQPGDRAAAESIQTLMVGGDGEYSAALLNLQTSLPVNAGRDVTLFAFGNVQLTNQAVPAPQLLVTATGTLNIRERPTESAEILAQIGVRESLTANGRTSDNTWLRVIVTGQRGQPDTIGWASVSSITVSGNINALNVIAEPTQPFLRPFQSMIVTTGENDARCDGTPESGLLIQSPGTDEYINLLINGYIVELAGTVFLQAPDAGMKFYVLDGEARIENTFVPAGTVFNIESVGYDEVDMPEPYRPESLVGLPLNNLPVRFVIPQPLSPEQIEAAQMAYLARFITPTAPPPDPTLQAMCRRTVIVNTDLHAGPGTNYETVNSIAAETRIVALVAADDLNGTAWYQLQSGNWINAGFVSETGLCEPVPGTTFSEAPASNRLILETCGTTNGPIRAGQMVTIEFVPPAFDNLIDANNALRIDPGRIVIENRRQSVRASAPQSVGSERYVRVFSTTWTAVSGTYRITGARLSYEVICDIVVSVG